MGYKMKKFLNFFNPLNLQRMIKEIGYSLNLWFLLGLAVIFGACAVICGYWMKLELSVIAVLAIGFVCCIPFLIMAFFMQKYESRRFMLVSNYCEKLIYSFEKSNKIRESLTDFLTIAQDELHPIIVEMIRIIDDEKSYRKAFDYFESFYNCSRVVTLHRYLIDVEENGGETSETLSGLLDDVHCWTSRTIDYQSGRKDVQRKVLVSTLFAMGSCGIMINRLPAEYVEQIVALPIYQWGTAIILLCCLILYTAVSRGVAVTYLDNELDKKTEESEIRAAQYIVQYREESASGKIKKTMINKLLVFIVILACISADFFILHYYIKDVKTYMITMMGTLLAGAFAVFQKQYRYNTSIKRTQHSIEKAFPEWLRSLLLYLQTDNVHVSLRKTYPYAPRVIKPELKTFLEGIGNDVVSQKPYENFLKDYDLPQLHLVTNYLYSILIFGSDNIEKQMAYLVDQNQKLIERAELQRNSDNLSLFTMLMLAPMLLAVVKLLLDLILFMMIFMTALSSSAFL